MRKKKKKTYAIRLASDSVSPWPITMGA